VEPYEVVRAAAFHPKDAERVFPLAARILGDGVEIPARDFPLEVPPRLVEAQERGAHLDEYAPHGRAEGHERSDPRSVPGAFPSMHAAAVPGAPGRERGL